MSKLSIAKNLQIQRSRTTLLFNHWTPERTAAAVGVNRDEEQMQQSGETERESVQARNGQLLHELESTVHHQDLPDAQLWCMPV
jgi:hypothetical protein